MVCNKQTACMRNSDMFQPTRSHSRFGTKRARVFRRFFLTRCFKDVYNDLWQTQSACVALGYTQLQAFFPQDPTTPLPNIVQSCLLRLNSRSLDCDIAMWLKPRINNWKDRNHPPYQ